MSKKNKMLIFSGCAGSGKGTVLKKAMLLCPALRLSVSMTTRKPRTGEVNGREYTFVTKEEFLKTLAEDGFVEHTEYCGNFYGTPKKQFYDMIEEGFMPVLEIETDGAAQVMEKFDDFESVFLAPPDYTTLEKRLRGRETETEKDLLLRLEAAKTEIFRSSLYRNIIVNYDGMADEAAEAMAEICENGYSESRVVVKDKSDFINKFINK